MISSACRSARSKLRALRDYVNSATGWDTTSWELIKVGERANTMSRLFNLREGLTAADDTLPRRMFEPLENGKLEGVPLNEAEFEDAISPLLSDGRLG